MIIGVGVDTIEPERIARAIQNERFLARVYTDGERAHIAAAGRAGAQRAAGIFAAKEAALKALGCGLSGAALCEAEVKWNGAGRPELSFHGRAYEKFKALGGVRSHLSITHIESAATAFAVLEGE